MKSEIYRCIVTSKFRTEKLLNFYSMIGDEPNKNSIYATFGRSEPWAANETAAGFAPPYPIDSALGVQDVWSSMLGAVKINRTLLDAVVPRRDWGDVRYPNPRNFAIDDIIVTNTSPYNKSPGATGWRVYKVVDIPESGMCSIASIITKDECVKLGGKWTSSVDSYSAPSGTGDTEGIVDTGDGYLWEYLYEIPSDVTINRCTNEYIVVPFPDELAEDTSRWGYQNNISLDQSDYELIYRLKVTQVRFKAYLDSIYFPSTTVLGNKGFRQISIIMNPIERKNKPTDFAVKAKNDYYQLVDLERHTGEMIYIENRQPIIRSTDQTEEISIVFEF